MTSAFSAMAYAIAVGPRRTIDFKNYKPSSPNDVFLGTVLLWFGWFGFNGMFWKHYSKVAYLLIIKYLEKLNNFDKKKVVVS